MDHDHHMGEERTGSAPFPAHMYGKIFWYTLLAIFFLGACLSWLLVSLTDRRARTGKAKTGRFYTAVAIVREASYLQRTILRITLPTLGQMHVCVGYLVLLLSCLLSQVWAPVPVFWEAISMRAAYLSLAQLVLVIALASKKNAIALLFATSHERVNVFHRFVSICLLMTTTLHMGYFLKEWHFYQVWADQWQLLGQSVLIWGFGAWGLLIFINVSSIGFVRHRLYTYWLPLHIASMIAFIGLVWRHTTPNTRIWVYVMAGLFLVDRLLRVVSRLFVTRGRVLRSGALLEALPGAVTRVELPGLTIPGLRPGQFIYLSLYKLGIHSHPFTVISTPSARDVVLLMKAKRGLTHAIQQHATSSLPPTIKLSYSLEGPYGGSHLNPAGFDTVLLIAGGVGATFTTSLLQSLVARPGCCRRVQLIWIVKEAACMSWFSDSLERIQLRAREQGILFRLDVYVTCDPRWAETQRVERAATRDECACKLKGKMQVQAHKTCNSVSSEEEIFQDTALLAHASGMPVPQLTCCCEIVADKQNATQPAMCMRTRRPDLNRAMLQHLVQDHRKGETGVYACGPASLTGAVRTAVVRASEAMGVKKGTGAEGIYLHVENQS